MSFLATAYVVLLNNSVARRLAIVALMAILSLRLLFKSLVRHTVATFNRCTRTLHSGKSFVAQQLGASRVAYQLTAVGVTKEESSGDLPLKCLGTPGASSPVRSERLSRRKNLYSRLSNVSRSRPRLPNGAHNRTVTAESAQTFASWTSYNSAGNGTGRSAVTRHADISGFDKLAVPVAVSRHCGEFEQTLLAKMGFPESPSYMHLPNGLRLAFIDMLPDQPNKVNSIRHTLILFHGLSSWSFLWRSVASVLRKPPYNYRIICLDWPGFGLSDSSSKEADISWSLYLSTAKYVLKEIQMALQTTDHQWYDKSPQTASQNITIVVHGVMGTVVSAALAELGDSFISDMTAYGLTAEVEILSNTRVGPPGLKLVLVDPDFPGIQEVASNSQNLPKWDVSLESLERQVLVSLYSQATTSLWLSNAWSCVFAAGGAEKGYGFPFTLDQNHSPHSGSYLSVPSLLAGRRLPSGLHDVFEAWQKRFLIFKTCSLLASLPSVLMPSSLTAHDIAEQNAFAQMAARSLEYLQNFGTRAIGTTSFFQQQILKHDKRRLCIISGNDYPLYPKRKSRCGKSADPLVTTGLVNGERESFISWLTNWTGAEWVQVSGPSGWVPETSSNQFITSLAQFIEAAL